MSLLPALLTGAMVSLVVCAALIRWGPRDQPGGHKVHAAPTPVAGGLGVWAGTLVAAWLGHDASDAGALYAGAPLVLVVLAGLGMTVGLIDDIKVVPTRIKLLLLSIAAAAAAPDLRADLAFLPVALPVGLAVLLGLAGTWLWIMVCTNAVNFMDGSNGLAMGSVAVALVFLAGLAAQQPGAGLTVMLALAGVAGCVGFLVWNLPGKLFAGDTGSLFIGLWFAGTGLLATQQGVNAALVALCLLPVLADVILTIVWRARHDGGLRVLTQPHRQHLYQWLRRSGLPAVRVALIWWAATGLCGTVALALVASGLDRGWTPLLVLLVAAVLAGIIGRAVRQRLGPPPAAPG